MAKAKEAQATEEVAAVEEVKTTEETQTEETATEAQATEEVAASMGIQYIKTIPNKFDVAGCDIPNEEFDPSDLDMDEMQEKAFNHAVKCGIIKEVE